MKLKNSFVTQMIDDTQFLVPLGSEKFHGIVRNNATAAFIVDQLKNDTTKETIIDAMCAQYDAPRETIAADVEKALNTLRSVGALEE